MFTESAQVSHIHAFLKSMATYRKMQFPHSLYPIYSRRHVMRPVFSLPLSISSITMTHETCTHLFKFKCSTLSIKPNSQSRRESSLWKAGWKQELVGTANLNMSQDGSRWLWALEAEHKLEAFRMQGRACGDQKRRRSLWVLQECVGLRMGGGVSGCQDGRWSMLVSWWKQDLVGLNMES